VAEDLTQETFFRAYKHLDDFQGNCSLTTWLYQIAKNLFVDYLREDKKYGKLELNEEIAGRDNVSLVEEKENLKRLYRMIHQLDEPYKEVFLLRYNEELSFRELGEIFHKSENWARVIFYRAREKLRKKIKEGDVG